MTTWLILLLYILICSSLSLKTAVSKAPDNTGKDTLKILYSCDPTGNVTIQTKDLQTDFSRIAIYGNKGGSINEAASPTSGRSSSCAYDLSAIPKTAINLSGCILDTPIYVYIMKETLPNVYGGNAFHEFTLNCRVPESGVHEVVTAVATVSVANTPKPSTENPILTVDMTITPNSNVKIGQKLTVEMSVSGVSSVESKKIYVIPKNCMAVSGTNGSSINLLDNGISRDAEIMSNFTDNTKGSANATIYAFRFTDSATIRLTCIVYLCSEVGCDNIFQAYATSTVTTGAIPGASATIIPTAKGRKKRAIKSDRPASHVSSRFVKAMFTVEEDNRSKSGQASGTYSLICILAVLGVRNILMWGM